MTLPEPEVRSTRQHIATQWHIMGGGSVLKCKCGDWKSDPSQTAPQQREAHRDHREAMGETVLARQKKTGPQVRPFAYQVSCVPFDDPYSRGFTYLVKRIEGDVWGVTEDGFHYWYDAHGEHGYASSPERRFDEETAREVAKDLARKATVNGHTVGDALARIAEREANPNA